MLQHRKNLQEIKPNGYHICKGVKIGANVSVLPGVFIGENSIVGVGSVVTRDIPEYSIVHGSPARVRGIVEEEEII
jgi:acetyltransferase-like isoleucine patch superfamily enzyme